MRKTPMPPRKARLKARKGLGRKARLKAGAKGLKRVNRARRSKLWVRCFLSESFVQFTRAQPCVCRGKGAAWGCKGGPCQTSHDPSRGAGGTWKDTHPATAACHRKIGAGAETYWRLIGRTREEANRAHHFAFLAHIDGPQGEQ